MTRRNLLSLGALALGSHAARAEDRLRVIGEGGNHQVLYGDSPLFVYNSRLQAPPEGVGPLFARNGYLHPVYAPNGAALTDDFPADHRHQRGVFFAWTKTRLVWEGRELKPDFWNLGSGTGRIFSARSRLTVQDDGPAELEAQHQWQARTGDDWVTVLEETWHLTAYAPKGDRNAPDASWHFDLVSRQHPKVDLELPQHVYGGMAVRAARPWRSKASLPVVRTSEGKDRLSADGSRARWMDMQGQINGKQAGIALLSHPENLEAPQPLRVHPDVPYYVFTPPKAGALVLRAGREHVFRYRCVLHNGLNAGALDAMWKRFAG